MKFIKELKGGSLSKTVVMSNGNSTYVRKLISFEKDREYGLVRWQSQLRKLQMLREKFPDNILPILNAGVEGDSYYFDIPHVESGHNLFEALTNGVPYHLIADQLATIVRGLAGFPLASVGGSFSVYLNEEVKRPMQLAHDEVNRCASFLSADEKFYFKEILGNAISRLDQQVIQYKNLCLFESLTHGNFTLENAIWDYRNEKIWLVDCYAETYCETILGDVSQIYQSSLSGYEAISEYFTNSDLEVIAYPYERIPAQLLDFARYFESVLSNEVWYEPRLINLFRASQFTRMFPFKLVNNPRAGFLFMNHAVDLLGTDEC